MSPAFYEKPIQWPDRHETHVFFGFCVPYLTDFLRTYQESSGPELRKAILHDILAEQVQFLRSFHGAEWESCTLELRILNDPVLHQVKIYFLAKAADPNKQRAQEKAESLFYHILGTFPVRHYQLNFIEGTDAGRAVLKEILEAADDARFIYEYQRFERDEIVAGALAYVVYPFQAEEDSLYRLIHFLAGMETRAVYSAVIRPVTFSVEEHDMLAMAASLCRENERKTMELFSRQSQMVDVQAGNLADLYTHYLKVLQDPFLLRISVAFSGEHPSQPLLSSLASDFSRTAKFAGGKIEFSNRRGNFVRAMDEEATSARFNLNSMELLEWVPEQVSSHRLRRLVDATGANGALRLPVPNVGGLPGVELRPPNLFEPLPAALLHPPPDKPTIKIGHAHIELETLTKHALIAGTIGSGKTNTVFQLLHDLWVHHTIPFLVIEPVNARHNDYRALARARLQVPHMHVPGELRIFTLGDDTTSPLRLNPFEVPEGVILNSHLSGLVACFVAALPFSDDSPLPALFREAIRNIYFRCGWFEQTRGGQGVREVPTLIELRDELAWLIEQRYGKNTEVSQTMIGASVTRVNSLINSSAGPILLTRKSVPLRELFEKPVILELRHLGSEEDKALMTGFLLLFLQEYCDHNREVGQDRLNHVVVLEEAHNLMQKVDDPQSPKAAAVKFFTNMLAENRKYGQAFFVVEQIPTLLAEGAVKNTVTKVMHRMPGLDDIEVMGGAMNFKERHEVRSVCLAVGEAFLYTEGMTEATLVRGRKSAKDNPLSDAEVFDGMQVFRDQYRSVYEKARPFAGCDLCRVDDCGYRPRMARHSFDRALGGDVIATMDKADPSADRDEAFRQLTGPMIERSEKEGFRGTDRQGPAYCLFLHLQAQHKRLQFVPAAEVFRRLEILAKGE